MSELIVLLEGLGVDGAEAAEKHFSALWDAIRGILPEPLLAEVPKSRADLGGIFTASTKNVYLQIFNKLDDYDPITAVFDYSPEKGWKLERYTLSMGLFGPSYSAYTLADAALLSRQSVALRARGQVAEVQDQKTARVM